MKAVVNVSDTIHGDTSLSVSGFTFSVFVMALSELFAKQPSLTSSLIQNVRVLPLSKSIPCRIRTNVQVSLRSGSRNRL